MGGHYAPPPSPVLPLKELLRRAGFEVHESDGVVTGMRPRRVPDRGFLRMMIPRMVVQVRARGAGVTSRIRPDGLAWLMLGVLGFCVIFEWSLDRSMYPRDYSPLFIYGMSSVYLVLCIAEVVATSRAVQRALAGAHQG